MPKLSPRTNATTRGVRLIADDSIESRLGKRITVMPDGCWIVDNKPDRYANVYLDRRHPEPAHRFVYRTLVRPIRRGQHVHHKCFNKGCVNPQHLESLTPQEHGRLHDELDPLRFRGVGAPYTR